MIVKFLAAIVAFLLVVAGFHYTDPEVSNLVVAIVAFIASYLAYKYTPAEL